MSFLCWLKPGAPEQKFPGLIGRTTVEKLPAPKLIGRTAQKSFKRIWDLVMVGQGPIIGVQGMTGVGKTSITKNVYNQFLHTQSDQFDEVIWVSVSRDRFMISNWWRHIEKLIYRKRSLLIGDGILKVQDEESDEWFGDGDGDAESDEEWAIAPKKILLFVEGVTEKTYLDLLHFIEPYRKNGSKLVFTTRSVDMCTRMGCEEDCIVKVELLSKIEALELFWDTVKVKGNPTPRMTDVADEVVKECARLPLTIVAVGKKFRGKNEFEWDKLLLKIRNSAFGILKIAGSNDIYNHLNHLEFQGWEDIIELCALYPKDWKIPTKELIKYMAALDMEGGDKKLMLLKSNEILKSVEVDFKSNHEWGEGVQIQPLYRNVVLRHFILFSKRGLILNESRKESGKEKKWGEYLKWASFMCNNITTISISPKCPQLSVLFLNKNPFLCTISHNFFIHLTGLRILDLRDNCKMETLPDSISDLIDLRVLRLSRCCRLKHVPSLAKLLHMQMLELDGTAIEELPYGIELLFELTVLKLHSLSLREAIPSDYISLFNSLPNLELHL